MGLVTPIEESGGFGFMRTMRDQWSQAAAFVAPAPAVDIASAGQQIQMMLNGLDESRAGFERLGRALFDETRPVLAADHYFGDQSRETIARMAGDMREWAARYQTLAIPEGHPLASFFSRWVRLQRLDRRLASSDDRHLRRVGPADSGRGRRSSGSRRLGRTESGSFAC